MGQIIKLFKEPPKLQKPVFKCRFCEFTVEKGVNPENALRQIQAHFGIEHEEERSDANKTCEG